MVEAHGKENTKLRRKLAAAEDLVRQCTDPHKRGYIPSNADKIRSKLQLLEGGAATTRQQAGEEPKESRQARRRRKRKLAETVTVVRDGQHVNLPAAAAPPEAALATQTAPDDATGTSPMAPPTEEFPEFQEMVDRSTYHTVKHTFCPPGVLPMWVADMDLPIDPLIRAC